MALHTLTDSARQPRTSPLASHNHGPSLPDGLARRTVAPSSNSTRHLRHHKTKSDNSVNAARKPPFSNSPVDCVRRPTEVTILRLRISIEIVGHSNSTQFAGAVIQRTHPKSLPSPNAWSLDISPYRVKSTVVEYRSRVAEFAV